MAVDSADAVRVVMLDGQWVLMLGDVLRQAAWTLLCIALWRMV
jgi:hypothetical protein